MNILRKMRLITQRFAKDEAGASTVEMVIAMAFGLALGLAATQMIGGGSKGAAAETGVSMNKIDV